jgi:sulfite exporter TauE/SafE
MTHQIRVDDLPGEIREHLKNLWRDNGIQEVASLEFVALVKGFLPEQFVYDSL